MLNTSMGQEARGESLVKTVRAGEQGGALSIPRIAVVSSCFAVILALLLASCGSGNEPPVADSGDIVTALVGDPVALKGSASMRLRMSGR